MATDFLLKAEPILETFSLDYIYLEDVKLSYEYLTTGHHSLYVVRGMPAIFMSG